MRDSYIARLLEKLLENREIYFDKDGVLTSEGLKAVNHAIKVSSRRGYRELKIKLEKLRREKRIELLAEILSEMEVIGETNE